MSGEFDGEELDAQERRVRDLLRSAADVGPMPDDVVARLDEALRAARPATPVSSLTERRRSSWRSRLPRVLAAAAGIAVVGGGAVLVGLQGTPAPTPHPAAVRPAAARWLRRPRPRVRPGVRGGAAERPRLRRRRGGARPRRGRAGPGGAGHLRSAGRRRRRHARRGLHRPQAHDAQGRRSRARRRPRRTSPSAPPPSAPWPAPSSSGWPPTPSSRSRSPPGSPGPPPSSCTRAGTPPRWSSWPSTARPANPR